MAQLAVVLVADDEAAIAQTVAELVEDVGGRPLVAHDGREALELARSAPIHLVITDLMMPQMDGAALVQVLREETETQGTAMPRVILMSAANPAYVEAVPADALLRKPFDLTELEALLQQYLDI